MLCRRGCGGEEHPPGHTPGQISQYGSIGAERTSEFSSPTDWHIYPRGKTSLCRVRTLAPTVTLWLTGVMRQALHCRNQRDALPLPLPSEQEPHTCNAQPHIHQILLEPSLPQLLNQRCDQIASNAILHRGGGIRRKSLPGSAHLSKDGTRTHTTTSPIRTSPTTTNNLFYSPLLLLLLNPQHQQHHHDSPIDHPPGVSPTPVDQSVCCSAGRRGCMSQRPSH
jgi:hypothetical protein